MLIAVFPYVWYKARQEKRLRLQAERAQQTDFESRICPHCEQNYGDKVLATHYGQPEEPFKINGEFYSRSVILHCPHCDYLAVYDPQGSVLPGFVFKYQEIEEIA